LPCHASRRHLIDVDAAALEFAASLPCHAIRRHTTVPCPPVVARDVEFRRIRGRITTDRANNLARIILRA
jgi:hypothetical protein